MDDSAGPDVPHSADVYVISLEDALVPIGEPKKNKLTKVLAHRMVVPLASDTDGWSVKIITQGN